MLAKVTDLSVRHGEEAETAAHEAVDLVVAEVRRLDLVVIAIHPLASVGTRIPPLLTVGIEVHLLASAGTEDRRQALVEIGVAHSGTAATVILMATYHESIKTAVPPVDAATVENEAARPDILEDV